MILWLSLLSSPCNLAPRRSPYAALGSQAQPLSDLQYSHPLKRGAKWSPCSACPVGSPVPSCHFYANDMSVSECTSSLAQVHAKPLVSSTESALLCYGHFLASVKVSIYLLSFPCSVLFNFYLNITNSYTLYSYWAHEETELSDFPQQGGCHWVSAQPKGPVLDHCSQGLLYCRPPGRGFQ